MSDPTHFAGFDDPCVTARYDGTNWHECGTFAGVPVAQNHDDGMELLSARGAVLARPGQWLVRHVDNTVTTSDKEPPRVLGEFKREMHALNLDSEQVEFNGYEYFWELSNGALVPKRYAGEAAKTP